jgi:hypothetical protein
MRIIIYLPFEELLSSRAVLNPVSSIAPSTTNSPKTPIKPNKCKAINASAASPAIASRKYAMTRGPQNFEFLNFNIRIVLTRKAATDLPQRLRRQPPLLHPA